MHIDGTKIINECNEQFDSFSINSEEVSDNNSSAINNGSLLNSHFSLPIVEGIKVDDNETLSWNCINCTINISITINEGNIHDCKEDLKKLKIDLTNAEVVKDDEENIIKLVLNNGEEHTADLYIDCTGFISLLKEIAFDEILRM